MAKAPDSAATDLDDRDFNASALARTASWGIGAATALFLAVLAGLSESGAPRMAMAVSILTGSGKVENAAAAPAANPVPAAVAQPQPQVPAQLITEARRLNEQVRLLAADRDRLMHRIANLERNLEDVTGSIRRQEASAQTAAQAHPAELPAPAAAITAAAAPWPAIPPEQSVVTPWGIPPAAETPPEIVTAALPPATELPPATPLPPRRPVTPSATVTEPAPPAPAAASPKPGHAPSRTAYGVDLGGAVSVDRLRMLWHTLRTSEPRMLQGLRPVTHTRELRRGGRPDVRLIAGPLANADQAAQLCAAILNAGRYCEPAVFHGHRLSLR